jgi:hypothetical protein
MMKYKSPRALKDAFGRRYRDDPRRQLVLVMQRFVARVCRQIDSAVLKGGLGLELRLGVPRTTKDADIIISGAHDLDQRLTAAGKLDLGDFLLFRIEADKSSATFAVPGMDYHAKRYKVQAFFADKSIAPSQKPDRSFTLEASIRAAAGHDTIESTWEGFEQVPPATIRVYSLPWQIAEKVHAYTDLRHRESSNHNMMRPRDLIDLCRCAEATLDAPLSAHELRDALVKTFERRKSRDPSLHDLPLRLPPLPSDWEPSFDKHVQQDKLAWSSQTALSLAAAFIDPVLSEQATGSWDPADRVWK